jgi:arsenite methyltransferase
MVTALAVPPTTSSTWLADLLGVAELPGEGGEITLRGERYVMHNGVLRERRVVSDAQRQTAETFGFKWHKRDTFESPASLERARDWLVERYGDVAGASFWAELGPRPLLLDAGCGAGMSALALFDGRLTDVRYLGADISDAVDVAAARLTAAGHDGAFVQADLGALPLPERCVDVIFSEGVLHHTDSTRQALQSLASLLSPGGRFMFYVYRRKGPIREFTDDYVRARVQDLTEQEAWDALMPLTRLGQALGDMAVEVDVPERIDLLGIPAGRIDLQRLFYWHVFKAFHNPDLDLDELNHINYDWYAPRNAHRQSPEEVREWCRELGLEIEHEDVQEAGITVIARRAA